MYLHAAAEEANHVRGTCRVESRNQDPAEGGKGRERAWRLGSWLFSVSLLYLFRPVV